MPGTQNPKDLLPRLTSGSGSSHFPVIPKDELAPEENVELSLGLSLNGRFGLEPQRSVAKTNNNNNIKKNQLCRASSVVNFPVDVELSLTRTCSLPPETEVEWRKRKELQSLRRSEAKRKRLEKLKNLIQAPAPAVRFSPQGSIGSQESGGGSSGVSDLDSQPSSGTNEANKRSEINKVKCNPKTKAEKQHAYDETMPCVSTKGEGPDGKRIQGFLYRYGKDEEVRIVCVCHGSFLTPKEFVKHGGGGDVDHPLRHIIVTSLSS